MNKLIRNLIAKIPIDALANPDPVVAVLPLEGVIGTSGRFSNAINLSNDRAIEWITKNYKEFDILVTQGAGTISQLNNSIKEKWALKK